MIYIYYGEDRAACEGAARKVLGEGYEVLDGEGLTAEDLPSVFLGASLFATERRILLKDLSENKEVFGALPEYVGTEHKVVIWEKGFDKRTAVAKALAKAEGVEIREFKRPEVVDRNAAFNIFDLAMRDGERALGEYEKIAATQDPYQLLGAWSWKAIDNLKRRPNGEKEKRVLRELSKIDMQMKLTQLSSRPEPLLESFLRRARQL